MSTATATEPHADVEHVHEHPSDLKYVKIALLLGAITALEVVRAVTRVKKPNVLGFCVGGTILTSALAVLKGRGEDPVDGRDLRRAAARDRRNVERREVQERSLGGKFAQPAAKKTPPLRRLAGGREKPQRPARAEHAGAPATRKAAVFVHGLCAGFAGICAA